MWGTLQTGNEVATDGGKKGGEVDPRDEVVPKASWWKRECSQHPNSLLTIPSTPPLPLLLVFPSLGLLTLLS